MQQKQNDVTLIANFPNRKTAKTENAEMTKRQIVCEQNIMRFQ